jgi:hypothetical protein
VYIVRCLCDRIAAEMKIYDIFRSEHGQGKEALPSPLFLIELIVSASKRRFSEFCKLYIV